MVLIVFSCVVVGIFYIVTARNIESVYAEETRQVVYDVKENYLRDTVQNLISRIDNRREGSVAQYTSMIEMTEKRLLSISQTMEESEFIAFFSAHFRLRTERGVWTAALWSSDSGEILFDSVGLLQTTSSYEEFLQQRLEEYAVYRLVQYHDLTAFYGVKWSMIDEIVKQGVAMEIHGSRFTDDTYIWVNEVLNFDGGDDYAIRRIHPNLRDTEGMSLSTNMADVAGNLPYLEELEGIKERGELFFTYFFKRLDTDDIAEKLTYARLYEPYNWIIAMGMHLEDMDFYVAGANDESTRVTRRLLPLFVVILVALVSLSIVSLLFLERIRSRWDSRLLEEEANLDSLTHIYNRRRGMIDLLHLFQKFKRGESAPSLIIFDIDDFKTINDQFGHAVGDQALRAVATCVTGYIRMTDRLYRWGGDEFVVVCEGMRPENVFAFSDSLRREVASLRWIEGKHEGSVTISVGVSYFHEEDPDFHAALLRADEAQYRAKHSGKNRVELSL